MSITIGLGDRLRDALAAAEARTPGITHELSTLFASAHAEASAVLDGRATHTGLAAAAGAWATLHDDVAGLEQRAALAGAGIDGRLPVHVGADGELWGVGTYENLDPGWTEALIHYLEHRHDRANVANAPHFDRPFRDAVARFELAAATGWESSALTWAAYAEVRALYTMLVAGVTLDRVDAERAQRVVRIRRANRSVSAVCCDALEHFVQALRAPIVPALAHWASPDGPIAAARYRWLVEK